jgi:hypothetical protein
MPDVAVARPFCYRGADGVNYEFGAGTVYPGMSQEFCDDPYVVHHTEAAVRGRGAPLIAHRRLILLSATGTYVPTPAWAIIWLSPDINPQYAQTLQLLDAPLFAANLDSFGDLDRPEIDLPVMPGNSFGFGNYRRWAVGQHNRPRHISTVRVFPGDGQSPPTGRVTDPDAGRARREEREHRERQAEQRVVQTAMAGQYLDPPRPAAPAPWLTFRGEQRTPTPAAMDWSRWTYRDPRVSLPVARHIEQQAPPHVEQPLPDYAILGQRERAKLEFRAPRR